MTCLFYGSNAVNKYFIFYDSHFIFIQTGNEKNESSASDEESFHLIGQNDKDKIQEDGPTYATVKKPKKTLQPSAQWVLAA